MNTRQVRANTGNRIALGVLILLVSLFCFLCCCGAFGGAGRMIYSFFVGFFGLAAFGFLVVGVIVGVAVIFNFKVRMPLLRMLKYFGLLLLGVWALHVYTSSAHIVDAKYGAYLVACYKAANTAGGMLLGIISFPLMKAVTSVGALVIVCVAFFGMAGLTFYPYIKKNVTYSTESRSKRNARTAGKPASGGRIGRQKAPTITDLSTASESGNNLFIVDVEGDPLQKSKRKAKGAGGYNPLYPNAAGGMEDEIRVPVRTEPDKYSAKGLAKDILFSNKPHDESLSRFNIVTNPNEALAKPGASYSSIKRNELKNRLGMSETDNSIMKEDFMSRYRTDAAQSNADGQRLDAALGGGIEGGKKLETGKDDVLGIKNQRSAGQDSLGNSGTSSLGYATFDALKEDQIRRFGQMYTKKSEPEFESTAYNKESLKPDSLQADGVKREVVKPNKVVQKPELGGSDNSDASASNMGGLHGAVARAITGEELPKAQTGYDMPAAQGYDLPDQKTVAKYNPAENRQNAAENRQNVAQQYGQRQSVEQNDQADARAQGRVPRAFEGTAVGTGAEVLDAAERAVEKQYNQQGNQQIQNRNTQGQNQNAYQQHNNQTQRQSQQQNPQPQQRPQVNNEGRMLKDGNDVALDNVSKQKFEHAVENSGRPIDEKQDLKSASSMVQQSLFAKQQAENIAKARKEAPPLSHFELLEAEKEKRANNRAPSDAKSLKKTESMVKAMENIDTSKERLTQVNMDQAISQAMPKRPYVAPPTRLLVPPEPPVSQNEDYEYKKQVLIETLDFFGVGGEVTDIMVGPTFSLYTLKVDMPKGRTVGSLVNLENDIAMKMEEESVRILAPIPGKNAVGIEVPNKSRRMVRLSELVMAPKFNQAKSMATFGLGVDLYGTDYVCDIRELPHMLIAGATGAGKSCCINSLIVSLLYKASPDDVRLIMVDPKRVELSVYSGIPHLLLDEIICDVDKAIRALNWSIGEMQRRINYLSELKFRDIDEYNQNCEKLGYEKMPRIIIIVDELADLISLGKKAVEDAINRLARLARAAGVHLILATQRPSVDVISGTIKNNLPTRIAFKVTAGPDSKTILDAYGAEKLLGNGDLLYMTPKHANPIRMQGAYISNSEVKDIVDFIKANNESYFDNKVKDEIFRDKAAEEKAENKDKLRKDKSGIPPEVFSALQLGLDGETISISFLQRKLGLGWPKAAKIYDLMSDMGFLAPDDKDPKRKKVVITQEELDELVRTNGPDGEDEE